jgi:hypothetical protein
MKNSMPIVGAQYFCGIDKIMDSSIIIFNSAPTTN